MKFRAALIGLGGIAWKYDAHVTSRFPLSQAGAFLIRDDVELVGGCSPDPMDREAFSKWSGVSSWSSELKMLEALRPEIVGICSPSGLHYEHLQACCNAGVRAVWLEKPPSLDLDETRSMIALAASSEVVVGVNYFRRYLPAYQRLRAALSSGELGHCHSIHIQYSPGLANNGCHLIDQLFFLTGACDYDILWRDSVHSSPCPSFVVQLSSGQIAFVCGGDLPYHSNSISVICDAGIASILSGGMETRFDRRVENTQFHGFYTLESQPDCFLGPGGLDHYMDYSLEALLAAYIKGIEPLSTLETSFVSQRLLTDILKRDE